MSFQPLGVGRYGVGRIGESLDLRPGRTQAEILRDLAKRNTSPQIIVDMGQDAVREAEAVLDMASVDAGTELA